MPQALADGVGIAYDDLRTDGAEDQPPLVLLTGWCSSKERWRAVAELCARHRRVLSTEWRGHRASGSPTTDFGLEEMVGDVLAVADDAGLEPVRAVRRVALRLRRAGAPAAISRADPEAPARRLVRRPAASPLSRRPRAADDRRVAGRARQALRVWIAGSEEASVAEAIGVMRRHGVEMWQRSGREIAAGYDRVGSPTDAWASLDPPVPVLHLYGQPQDPGFLDVQKAFAAAQPWFVVRKLPGVTRFAMLETPREVAAAIEGFVAG